MSYSLEVLTDFPRIYLRLGESSGTTAADSSGNGRTGAYTNGPTLGVTGALVGDANTAVTLDGSNDYVAISAASWMNIADYSVEVWFKSTSTTAGVYFATRDNAVTGTKIWGLGFNNTAGDGKVVFVTWSSVSGSLFQPLYSTTAGFNDGAWHHVVAVKSGNMVLLYVDGVLENSSTAYSAFDTSSAVGIDLGRRGNSSLYFPGTLDEFAFYPTALSAARIATHYRAGLAAVTLAATMPSPTLAVALTAEFASNLTVAGTMPSPTLAVDLSAAGATLTVAGTMPTPTLAVALDSAGDVPLHVTGAMPSPTLAVSLTVESTADLAVAGTMPTPTLAVTLSASDEVDVGGTMPLPTLAVTLTAQVVYGTDTDNRDDGVLIGDGVGTVDFEADAMAVPAHLSAATVKVMARAISTAPTWTTGAGYDLATATTAETDAGALQVRINGKDWTYYRDAPIVVETVKLIDPLRYGNARVTIPGINPQFPGGDLGDADDLVALFKFARVKIKIGSDVVHKGFVSRVDTSGTTLSLEVGGEAAGALSQMYVPPAVYRKKQDVEHILVDLLRDARVQTHEHDGSSGVGLIRRGGADGLSIFNETLAVWAGSTGSAVTFTPNADGIYRKTTKPDDDDTVDATAYIDENLITQDLAQDFMEQYTRVYAHGTTPAGELVTNIKTPGLTQGAAPDFPLESGTLGIGDDDDDTTSGAGVTAIQQQLGIHNFIDPKDWDPGKYDLQLSAAVKSFQRFAGLNVTGEVGENTWNALWDLTSIGYSLGEAREYPQAQDTRTQKWFRTANGSKISENPDYDPAFIPNDLFIDVGGPFTKGQIRDFAESMLVPSGGVWTGTLTFRSGLIKGDHSPGDALTEGDVMDRWELLPNMRIKLPHFAGGIVVYVSGVEHTPGTGGGDTGQTTALVSTVPATTMETWQAIERRREARSNPGRAWSGHTRASQVRQDRAGRTWDTTSGWVANKVALVSGWNEVKVPAGQAGIVQRVRVELEDAHEFALLLTQRPVSVKALNDNTHTATPLTDPRPDARPWWEQKTVVDWLDDRGKLDAWGTPGQPCGYDPSLKTDDQGPTAAALTGLFVEGAGLNYETGVEPVLYLYIYVGQANTLKPGRILTNQRTADF